MAFFSHGVILPFQKGEIDKIPTEALPGSCPMRIPLTDGQNAADISTQFDETTVYAAGAQLYRSSDTVVPVLTGVCGRIIGTVVINHPQYGELLCAQFQPETTADRSVAPLSLPPLTADTPSPDDICAAARDAAIYDELDGVPLWEKLKAWQSIDSTVRSDCRVLVADATENDIFGSSAWTVLAEMPRAALTGLQLAAKAIHFSRYHIATMLPKTRRRAVKRAIGRDHLFTVPDEYPVTRYAEERTTVYKIGVQACVALAEAILNRKKSTGVLLTVAGDGVPRTFHLTVPYGTTIEEILTYCQASDDATVILGDAMTGVACEDRQTPLLPGTTTLIVMEDRRIRLPGPCIGCGRCATVCHAELLPYEIVRRFENMHYERLQHLSPQNCDGCAACSYVCPAGRDVAADVLRAGETGDTMLLTFGEDD